jgi:hypothetical protein
MIVYSTLPLVRSASFILLQGVPTSVRLDKLKKEIGKIQGVVGVHELHIWQLSDTKAVASVHVVVKEPLGNQKVLPVYKSISKRIKKTLHGHGIHSTTVQTEFIKTMTTSPSLKNETSYLGMETLVGCVPFSRGESMGQGRISTSLDSMSSDPDDVILPFCFLIVENLYKLKLALPPKTKTDDGG